MNLPVMFVSKKICRPSWDQRNDRMDGARYSVSKSNGRVWGFAMLVTGCVANVAAAVGIKESPIRVKAFRAVEIS